MNGKGMSSIVKTVALVMVVPITVFGLYIISHGHLTPGGGFPGGAVIASLAALLVVAFGSEIAKKLFSKNALSLLESVGLVSFALLAFMGLGSSFFRNTLVNSGGLFGTAVSFGSNPGFVNTAGLIPLMNFAVGLEVLAAISAIILVMYAVEVKT